MSMDLTDDKSTLVPVMASWHQARTHYLSQCWPSSMSSYGVTRPQWVKSYKAHVSALNKYFTNITVSVYQTQLFSVRDYHNFLSCHLISLSCYWSLISIPSLITIVGKSSVSGQQGLEPTAPNSYHRMAHMIHLMYYDTPGILLWNLQTKL